LAVKSKVLPDAMGRLNHQLMALSHWKRNETGDTGRMATFFNVTALTCALGTVSSVFPLATLAWAASAGAATASMTTRRANSTTTIATPPDLCLRTTCGLPMSFLLWNDGLGAPSIDRSSLLL
jgi:hypothetical protein